MVQVYGDVAGALQCSIGVVGVGQDVLVVELTADAEEDLGLGENLQGNADMVKARATSKTSQHITQLARIGTKFVKKSSDDTLVLQRMDFEAISSYNKNILRPATSEEFRDI